MRWVELTHRFFATTSSSILTNASQIPNHCRFPATWHLSPKKLFPSEVFQKNLPKTLQLPTLQPSPPSRTFHGINVSWMQRDAHSIRCWKATFLSWFRWMEGTMPAVCYTPENFWVVFYSSSETLVHSVYIFLYVYDIYIYMCIYSYICMYTLQILFWFQRFFFKRGNWDPSSRTWLHWQRFRLHSPPVEPEEIPMQLLFPNLLGKIHQGSCFPTIPYLET